MRFFSPALYAVHAMAAIAIAFAILGYGEDGWNIETAWSELLSLFGGLGSFLSLLMALGLGLMFLGLVFYAIKLNYRGNETKMHAIGGTLVVLFFLAGSFGWQWVELPDNRGWFFLVFFGAIGIETVIAKRIASGDSRRRGGPRRTTPAAPEPTRLRPAAGS